MQESGSLILSAWGTSLRLPGTESWLSPAPWLVVRAPGLCMGVKQISALSGRRQKGTNCHSWLKDKVNPVPMAFTLSPILSLNVKMAWQEMGLALFEACGYFRIIRRF